MILLLFALQVFTPAPLAQRTPDTLSAGFWESCLLDDGSGDYGEKALDYQSGGKPWFEIHYGPRDSFAIFAGNTPTHIDHDDERNLLRPAYHYNDLATSFGGRNWSFAALGISLNVIALPPSKPECYNFTIQLTREKRPTWVQR
jgi:hypothetical protein